MENYIYSSPEMQEKIEAYLPRITEHRRDLLVKVVQNRTRHFCMVLEDLFDPHNISAVIRTAEVFGLEDVHVIEEVNPYKVNKSILKGSIKWMNIYLHKKRMACMEHLRKKGYRIAVASTNTNNSVLDLDLSQPTAFYLGSEFTGNNPDTLAAADCEFKLPQYGITESMNVSVAGGVLMCYLDHFMQQKGRQNFTLSPKERDELLLEWLERHLNDESASSSITRIGDE
ncbi:RNA methyltransferase [Hallerella succinigenes]|uniref:TrmH family RNA methyltransferase n=1 Tax=Hallerella succinigenes TaxID=1896222 RepID=UPI002A825DCD|nr:RNA methyltransferase [Hallerella succinigenes]MDY5029919.1 RNA methyltransferase [Hallerella succinigenes]